MKKIFALALVVTMLASFVVFAACGREVEFPDETIDGDHTGVIAEETDLEFSEEAIDEFFKGDYTEVSAEESEESVQQLRDGLAKYSNPGWEVKVKQQVTNRISTFDHVSQNEFYAVWTGTAETPFYHVLINNTDNQFNSELVFEYWYDGKQQIGFVYFKMSEENFNTDSGSIFQEQKFSVRATASEFLEILNNFVSVGDITELSSALETYIFLYKFTSVAKNDKKTVLNLHVDKFEVSDISTYIFMDKETLIGLNMRHETSNNGKDLTEKGIFKVVPYKKGVDFPSLEDYPEKSLEELR